MTALESEALVLVAATTLAGVVLMRGARGTLGTTAGMLLLTLVMLATVATLLHMAARWW